MSKQTEPCSVALDQHGYLLPGEHWSPAVARELAAQDGLLLTEQHWKVISALRNFHAQHSRVLNNRALVALLRDSGVLVGNVADQLKQLFNPVSPVSQIARVAGLPKSRSCFEYRSF